MIPEPPAREGRTASTHRTDHTEPAHTRAADDPVGLLRLIPWRHPARAFATLILSWLPAASRIVRRSKAEWRTDPQGGWPFRLPHRRRRKPARFQRNVRRD